MLPYLNWDGLIRCPYHWADDIACMYKNKINIKDIRRDKYFVFGFHPIHIYLNTESLYIYESVKYKTINEVKFYKQYFKNGAYSILKKIVNN